VGDYVKKKMGDCTGKELLRELLWHMGAGDQTEEIIATSKVIPSMMPYITSQFMPRIKGDRPDVVPKGSVNLAFLGQFVEIPGDCVFTVEYSVRSAMMGVYTLLNLDKQPPEVYPSQYDLRVIANAIKSMHGDQHLPGEGLIRHLLKGTSMEGLI
jgi:oleate hydratase